MIKDVAMLNVNGAAMVGAPGSYAKVFDVLGKNNINVMMISTAVSEANISMVIKRGVLGRAISNLEIALLERGGIVSEVSAEDDVAVIAVMGANMKGTLGCCIKNIFYRRKKRHQHPHDSAGQLRTQHIFCSERKRRSSRC